MERVLRGWRGVGAVVGLVLLCLVCVVGERLPLARGSRDVPSERRPSGVIARAAVGLVEPESTGEGLLMYRSDVLTSLLVVKLV